MLKKRFSIMQSKLNIDSIGVNSKKLKYYYNQKRSKVFFLITVNMKNLK